MTKGQGEGSDIVDEDGVFDEKTHDHTDGAS
jgi:hypothetical protein